MKSSYSLAKLVSHMNVFPVDFSLIMISLIHIRMEIKRRTHAMIKEKLQSE